MNSGPSLPVLPKGFGRAAEKLADTIRHVVDVAVGPDRIRARAQAQADAALIIAEGRTKIQELEARAIERLRKREARRQQNIEGITLKALNALPSPDQISDEPVSEDWTSRFFEECQDISEEQMQQIWARIMAGEVARPGSFSPRTLSVVRDLTKSDADLFAKLCEFVWLIPGVFPETVPVILNLENPELVKASINFGSLTHLTSIGLIEFNNSLTYGVEKLLNEIVPSYFGKIHHLKVDGGAAHKLSLGKAIFTISGAELVKISSAKDNDEYRKATLKMWNGMGWKEAGGDVAKAATNEPV
jgi:hypothetical protein